MLVRRLRSVVRTATCALTLSVATTAIALTAADGSGSPSSGTGAPATPAVSAPHLGMRWIAGGAFRMGARDSDDQARGDERPQHPVTVHGFWMDADDVTNADFAAFVTATGYRTTAERKPDWELIKTQVPPGTPRPDDALLVPGALVFSPPDHAVPLNDPSRWWSWVPGADWRHPRGPGSGIGGLERHPVVQVSWDDAVAYARWIGKRLPTEAEWECAARGGLAQALYAWGDEPLDQGPAKANTFHGHFPDHGGDGQGGSGTSPVGSFPPNPFGLHDMSGNVWEWCSDWYRADTYQRDRDAHPQGAVNPQGPDSSLDADEPLIAKRVVRGGSFLCHESYCASYRVSARMKSDPQTSMNHTGFRCVVSP